MILLNKIAFYVTILQTVHLINFLQAYKIASCIGTCKNGFQYDTANCSCHCSDGFYGEHCELYDCNYTPTLDSQLDICEILNCSNDGVSESCPFKCLCGGSTSAPSTPPSVTSCSGTCKNGFQYDTSTCSCHCSNGFSGEKCENYNCTFSPALDSKLNGLCDILECSETDVVYNCPNKCLCGGITPTPIIIAQSTPILVTTTELVTSCTGTCDHGFQYDTANCSCHCSDGFYGEHCELYDCNYTPTLDSQLDICEILNCSNDGVSESCPFKCLCGGSTSAPSTPPPVTSCSGTCKNGFQYDTSTCSCHCSNGFSGTECESYDCNYSPSLDSQLNGLCDILSCTDIVARYSCPHKCFC